MVNTHGACPQPPMRPEPKMPSIEPLVSVKSVNGQTGEVVLKDLIIGESENAKRYNGSDQKRITAADLGLGNAFRYCGIVKTIEKAEEKMLDAKCGDVYFCKEDEKFYLSVGEGEYKLFSNGQGGGEPEAYLRDALVDADTLTITKNDGSTIDFKVDLEPIEKELGKKQNKLTAGENITIENNVISAKGGTKVAGMYIGSVVRDAGNPAPQRNLIGLTRDNDVENLEELKTKGYSNYIADNFSCTCFAYPQSLGTLTSVQMNDVPFEMLPMFNRYDDYKAADGTKFYIYTYNQTVNPEYNKYVLKWN